MEPIGRAHTPFKEKFGIPRQSGLVPAAVGELEFFPPYNDPLAFEGLESCSHLWLQFLFHQQPQGWSPRVRPPRLGGNEKLGVFATRSPNRPNRLGLSVVQLLEVVPEPFRLRVGGIDLLDGTPILDVKPYLPYADSIPEASYPGFEEPPQRLPVSFNCEVEPEFKELLRQYLSLDPRPPFHEEGRIYGNRVGEVDVRWKVTAGEVVVLEIRSGPE